jgi:hypothetical protein
MSQVIRALAILTCVVTGLVCFYSGQNILGVLWLILGQLITNQPE